MNSTTESKTNGITMSTTNVVQVEDDMKEWLAAVAPSVKMFEADIRKLSAKNPEMASVLDGMMKMMVVMMQRSQLALATQVNMVGCKIDSLQTSMVKPTSKKSSSSSSSSSGPSNAAASTDENPLSVFTAGKKPTVVGNRVIARMMYHPVATKFVVDWVAENVGAEIANADEAVWLVDDKKAVFDKETKANKKVDIKHNARGAYLYNQIKANKQQQAFRAALHTWYDTMVANAAAPTTVSADIEVDAKGDADNKTAADNKTPPKKSTKTPAHARGRRATRDGDGEGDVKATDTANLRKKGDRGRAAPAPKHTSDDDYSDAGGSDDDGMSDSGC